MADCITTKRLTLRRFRPADAAQVADLVGDYEVARWLVRVPHPYAVADAHSFITTHAPTAKGIYAVTLADQVIGSCSIEDELGFWLGQPFWGAGYATEAARAVIAQYFDQSDADLVSGYVIGNDASSNVLQKLGFERGNIVEQTSLSAQEPVHIQKMVLCKADWDRRT